MDNRGKRGDDWLVMVTRIDGQPPSEQLRAELADAGNPVILAFSRGKDSLAAWLAMRNAGIEVIPIHLYLIPGLEFVENDLQRWEDYFGQHIISLPHPSLFRLLNSLAFQPPERCATIEAADLPEPSYEEINDMVRQDLGVPEAWVADGVRAADSPMRRISMRTHGVRKQSTRKISVIWDWLKDEVMGQINAERLTLSVEYEWFGRSFDGIDRRFLEPMREHAPDDYARVLEWFPLADLELCRA